MGHFSTDGVSLIAIILASSISTAICCNPNKVFENKLQQSLVSTLQLDIISLTYKLWLLFKLKKMLETKVNGLEAKIVELETKNLELERKVKQLERKVWKLETQPNSISTVQKSFHRSCHEMFAAGVFLISGFYWIDPDGLGTGDDPINVYCEKTTGKYEKIKFQF